MRNPTRTRRSKARRQATPSLKPQGINERNWYYERRNHIELIHEVYHPKFQTYANGMLQVDHIKIPWRLLEQSRERCLSPRKSNSNARKGKKK